MKTPLSSPQLRTIIVAYTVNRLGTWFGLLALLVAVYDHTHSALATAALLFAGQALPALVVPMIVARVEASKGRGELAGLYFFEAVATAALAVLVSHFWLPSILLLVALDGAAALAASALLRAELARVAHSEADAEWANGLATRAGVAGEAVDREALAQRAERRANAALNVGFSSTFVLGPALAGAVVAAAGAPTALLVDVGSFVIGGALLINLHPHIDVAGGDSVRARLEAAWLHISGSPSLRGLLIAETAALIVMECAGPIEVSYVKSTLHAGDRGLGLLLTIWGVGAIVGSLVFARLLQRALGSLLSGGIFAIALGYLGLALAPTLALACVAGFVGGIGNGLQWPSLISAVQRLTPQDLHGRLMAAAESLGAVCVAIGLPLGGVLAAVISPRDAFVAAAVGGAGATLALLRVSRKSRAGAYPDAVDLGREPCMSAAAESPGDGLPQQPIPQ